MRDISRPHGFAVVLLLVLVSASLQVAVPDADWSQMLTLALSATTLAVSVWAARAEHPLVRATVAVAIVLTLASFPVVLMTGDVPKASTALVNGLLVALAPLVIVAGVVRDLRSTGEVTMRTLAGVLAIYLLLGMFFSFVDTSVAVLQSGPFFAGEADPTRGDFLYFSYVTLSTVGYGDLTAISDVGRMFAVTEALLGQIYLVTIVGLIVGNMRQRTPTRGREASDRPTSAG